MTLSIFNDQSRVRQAVQLVNAINMVYVVFHFCTKPKARLSENGLSFLVALLNFAAFQNSKTNYLTQGAHYLNVLRLGATYSAVTSGASGFSRKVNLLQTMLDFSNMLLEIVTNQDQHEDVDGQLLVSNQERRNCLSSRHLLTDIEVAEPHNLSH